VIYDRREDELTLDEVERITIQTASLGEERKHVVMQAVLGGLVFPVYR
jgi:hypothetical protein